MTAAAFAPRSVRGAVVLLISAVGVEFLHRQLLAVAQPSLLPELGLSDTEAGLLVFGFAAAYSVSAPLIGRVADRANRRNLYAAAIALWSLATLAGAWCGSFLALLATRIVVGAAQGVSGACNNPLISDYVPPERRSTAFGLVGVGAALGVIAAMTAGGVVTERLGWRTAFVWGGIAGLVFVALFLAVVREPPRGWSEGRQAAADAAEEPHPSWGDVLRTVAALPALRHVMFAGILGNTALLLVAQWGPTYFVRVHGLGVAEGGLAGGVGAIFAVAGGVLGGVLADRAWRTSPRSVLLIPALCFTLATPLVYMAFSSAKLWSSLVLLVAATGLGMVHTAPVGAVVQALAPLRMRAVLSGAYNASLTLVAMGGGPLLAGWLSDRLAGADGGGLSRALAWSAGLYLLAGLHLWLAARSFAADLDRSASAAA